MIELSKVLVSVTTSRLLPLAWDCSLIKSITPSRLASLPGPVEKCGAVFQNQRHEAVLALIDRGEEIAEIIGVDRGDDGAAEASIELVDAARHDDKLRVQGVAGALLADIDVVRIVVAHGLEGRVVIDAFRIVVPLIVTFFVGGDLDDAALIHQHHGSDLRGIFHPELEVILDIVRQIAAEHGVGNIAARRRD